MTCLLPHKLLGGIYLSGGIYSRIYGISYTFHEIAINTILDIFLFHLIPGGIFVTTAIMQWLYCVIDVKFNFSYKKCKFIPTCPEHNMIMMGVVREDDKGVTKKKGGRLR